MVFHSNLSLLRCKLQFILDSSKAHEEYFKDSNSDHLSELEYESRRLCYLLHEPGNVF